MMVGTGDKEKDNGNEYDDVDYGNGGSDDDGSNGYY